MIKEDFNLKNVNKTIEDFVKNEKLNFCKMVVQSYEEDLSVIGQYKKPCEYFVLDSQLNPIWESNEKNSDEYYYGVSPCIDSKTIVECVSNLRFSTLSKIRQYLIENRNFFMVQEQQKKYLKYLAEYILVVMSSHFGIKVQIEEELYKELLKYLEIDKKMIAYNDEMDYMEKALEPMGHYNHQRKILTIYGCPTEKLLSFLERYYYKLKKNTDGNVVEIACEAANVKKEDDKSEIISIKEVYKKYVDLVKGRVFYSGVLLKPVFIEIMQSLHENDRIQSICINFVRSTYGTVCALDANFTNHPVLNEDKKHIIEMLQEDDTCKQTLNKNLSSILALNTEHQKISNGANEIIDNRKITRKVLEEINNYLKKSINVNQIGVSANIVTREGLMLLGQRNLSSIDEGKLYPGVNGNAEVADKNVSFYSTSVYEDYPTIRLNDDRIDFFGEIGRETYGELQQDLSKQEWICYGIIISGNMPGSDSCDSRISGNIYTEEFRRLHFNLIFEHPCEKSFEEIEESSIKAAEAFETKGLLGVSVKCAKSKRDYLWKGFLELLETSVNHKDFIEGLVTLILFLLTIKVLDFQRIVSLLMEREWQDEISLFLAVIIVIVSVRRIWKRISRALHKRRKTKSIIIYENAGYDTIGKALEEQFNNNLRKKAFSFHPAAYASLLTYVENKTYDTFYPKDRR